MSQNFTKLNFKVIFRGQRFPVMDELPPFLVRLGEVAVSLPTTETVITQLGKSAILRPRNWDLMEEIP